MADSPTLARRDDDEPTPSERAAADPGPPAEPDLTIRALLDTQGISSDHSAGETVGAPRAMEERELRLRALRLVSEGADPGQSGADLELVATLGQGGMGIVHLARQPSLGRDVAVKRLRVESPVAAARLLREARITGKLEHPNIVPVHALGLDADGLPAVVMKRISGASWLELASSGEPIERHVEILVQVCNAIHFAHQRGIVHRDVKLENVMVGELGEVYVLDWGVALDRGDARAMLERGIVGTASYMAPEMVRGDPRCVDERTDVYLLGATLHHLLVGEPRHTGSHILTALHAALVSEPHAYPDGVPSELGEIANRACAADPAERHQSALELREALRSYLHHRAARELAALGRARVEELERLLDDLPLEADEPPEVRAAYDEASFAFREALRMLDEPSIRAARERAAERLFDARMAREDVGGASVLLDALDPTDEPRRAALEALRARADERAARLAFFEREHDLSIGRRPRVLFAFGISGTAALVTVLMLLFPPQPNEPRPGFSVGLAAAALLLVAAPVAVFRRRLLATDLSRRLVMTGVVAMAAVLISRVVYYYLAPPAPLHAYLIADHGILTVGVATLALRARAVWPIVGFMVVEWILIGLLPHWQVPIFLTSGAVVPAMLAWVWAREGTRPVSDGPHDESVGAADRG